MNQWSPPPHGGEVRVLLPPDHKKHTTFFFSQTHGSSWHQDDAKYVIFLGDHLIIVMLFVSVVVYGFFYAQYKFYQNPTGVLSFPGGVRARARWGMRFVYRLAQRLFRTGGGGSGVSPRPSRSNSPGGVRGGSGSGSIGGGLAANTNSNDGNTLASRALNSLRPYLSSLGGDSGDKHAHVQVVQEDFSDEDEYEPKFYV